MWSTPFYVNPSCDSEMKTVIHDHFCDIHGHPYFVFFHFHVEILWKESLISNDHQLHQYHQNIYFIDKYVLESNLHDLFISLRREVWFHKTSLTPPLFSPLQAKPEGDYSFRFRPSVRLYVRHIKILSCPDFFWRPLIYWLDIWYVAISRWVTV